MKSQMFWNSLRLFFKKCGAPKGVKKIKVLKSTESRSYCVWYRCANNVASGLVNVVLFTCRGLEWFCSHIEF